MNTNDFPFQLIDKLSFSPQPKPLAASLRPIYRISLILLILKLNCRGNTASLLKLQFFNWLLKSPTLQNSIKSMLTEHSVFSLDIIHIDPMVNLALKYAYAENLISITNSSKYKLSERGQYFIENIKQGTPSTLSEEYQLLSSIGQRISEIRLRKDLL